MTTRKIKNTEEALVSLEKELSLHGLDKEGNILQNNTDKNDTVENNVDNSGLFTIENNENLDSIDDEEISFSEFELRQKKAGWDPAGDISAEDWAKSKPLYDAITDKNKELEELRKTVETLNEIFHRQEKEASQVSLNTLTQERVAAIKKGDVRLVDEIDKKIANFKLPTNSIPAAVAKFQEKHKDWLTGKGWKEKEMSEFIFKRDRELATYNMDPNSHMELLEKDLYSKYGDYFSTEKLVTSEAIPAVEKNSSTAIVKNSKRKYTINDLSPEQKNIANILIRQKIKGKPIMTMEKYIDELVNNGDLK